MLPPPAGAFFPLSPAFFHPALLLDLQRYNTSSATLQCDVADASSVSGVLSHPDTSPQEIIDTLDITTKV